MGNTGKIFTLGWGRDGVTLGLDMVRVTRDWGTRGSQGG